MNTTHTTPTGTAAMTIADTARALFRLPTRFEFVLNACFWMMLASGNVATAPRGYFPEHQVDTSGWVVRR